MNDYPKISIITPNFNGIRHLENTILSVLDQNYPNLEYIIIDGGSTDGSVELIEKYSNSIAYWESKPDNGLYHAIQKGFRKSTGEIMGWINSDDRFLSGSLFTISELFTLNKDVHWIQGYPVVIDDENRIVFHRPAVGSKFFFYLKDFMNGSFIQQESTFWTRHLWEKAGGYISTEYKFAGDFELWIRFYHHETLYLTDAMLGAFRTRQDGQMSKINYNDYLKECNQIIDFNYTLLSENDRMFLNKVIRNRKFNAKLPRSCAFLRRENLEKKISYPLPVLKFDFEKYTFTLKP